MKSKDFFIWSIIVIAIVAAVTSYITVLYLTKPILLANQQGYVTISGFGSSLINVIVMDPLVEVKPGIYGISDIVNFGTVSRSTDYRTHLISSSPGYRSHPFVLRNIGADTADVCLYLNSRFFDTIVDPLEDNSKAYIWIEPADIDPNAAPGTAWASLDDCASVGGCYVSSVYESCAFPTISAGCLDLDTAISSANAKLIINDFNKLDNRDEALVNVGVHISATESTAPKYGTITIIGRDASADTCVGL